MARRALIVVEGTRSNGLLYVKAAQRLGLHPITLSADPTQHDYLAAEGIEVVRVDTNNLDALIRECSRLRATYDIAGITSADEAVYATVGKLCRHFDLPGPNPTSVERCCDKFTQCQLLAEAGVPIPAYRLATDAAGVESAAAEIGLPVVLKPVVGRGSSGVRLCRNVDELTEHIAYLLGGENMWRSSPEILVEEFAQGPYYCAQLMGDKVVGIGTADFGPPPHFVFYGGIFPAPLTDDEHRRIVDVSLSCLRALDLGWGPTNIEFRWTKRGPVVIEVNPRLSGGPHSIQAAYGIDLITEHIKLVIGEEWNLHRRHSYIAAWRILLPDRDGILEWIGDERRAAAVPGIVDITLYVKPKTPIVRKGDYRDSLGYIIAVSPRRARTEAILQRAVELIDWSIAPFPTLGEQEKSAIPHLPRSGAGGEM
ncbi:MULTISPECIES: acetyl-CoA carboxylase biotin carboxylase subunit family protein [unclassified Mesorhizobium]|uniref:ATP-grasp domain-containing protein n=1 Tax=unclassified Mesorhizobium TaxID=325217 RepID=UPI000F75617E|nr:MULTISPECIES: acetyl-CoA carboxylase biotin carboxylase subunit family protein [unclassified Mesorhizobium]AZO18034.1 ATP-grasp domain-containing protein [Mesorhizobium sp. M2A.F.Ca.ET.043.05.1.1]RVB71419.1 ATP-grasp domain-containing protein [Mesorhizobium sp. M6A.T.Cr.TU.014.01.1.1]RWP94625.1 MAG: ATP-grasp domain-containing protein [Mesorhizobium sp.]RWP94815.1 MAG: ATP-grasp domain-containing protein [Mesorhizobium sp.]